MWVISSVIRYFTEVWKEASLIAWYEDIMIIYHVNFYSSCNTRLCLRSDNTSTRLYEGWCIPLDSMGTGVSLMGTVCNHLAKLDRPLQSTAPKFNSSLRLWNNFFVLSHACTASTTKANSQIQWRGSMFCLVYKTPRLPRLQFYAIFLNMILY